MAEDKLTRDDLVLLMESYRNMITMHQTILDQTTKTIDKLTDITAKQDNIISKQGMVCNSLNNIHEKIDGANGGLKEVAGKIDNHETQRIESDSKLTSKIHLGWIGMGTIIVTLLGVIATLSQFVHNHASALPLP
jgi:hypothetical protein